MQRSSKQMLKSIDNEPLGLNEAIDMLRGEVSRITYSPGGVQTAKDNLVAQAGGAARMACSGRSPRTASRPAPHAPDQYHFDELRVGQLLTASC